MNLFQKYGIKEVLDVVFYSITKIGDEIIYTPVLYLDTLKVSTIDKKAEKVSAQGGLGNKKLISWNFGKEISLQFSDALFSPASMSLLWGGKFDINLTNYTSAIVKLNITQKYLDSHFSIKAYPSPPLTNSEFDVIFDAIKEISEKDQLTEEDKVNFKKYYYSREVMVEIDSTTENPAITELYNFPEIVTVIINKIDNIKKIGKIDSSMENIEVLDRWEKCIVTNRDGFEINVTQQKENLKKYYLDDKDSSYVIYYDAKTMLPLLDIDKDGSLKGWSDESANFRIKIGTVYYKWSRTVKKTTDTGVLGKTFVIDADTFPGQYKIVGETYIREQKTQKDQRCQIVINQATIGTDTSITLQADGDPTTFDMQVDVLVPKNNIPMEIRTFEVEEDILRGGTMVTAQQNDFLKTHTFTEVVDDISLPDNSVIYKTV